MTINMFITQFITKFWSFDIFSLIQQKNQFTGVIHPLIRLNKLTVQLFSMCIYCLFCCCRCRFDCKTGLNNTTWYDTRLEIWLQRFCVPWFMSGRIGKCQDGIICNLEVWRYCIVLCKSVPCGYPEGTANPRTTFPFEEQVGTHFQDQFFLLCFLNHFKFYATFPLQTITYKRYAQRIKTWVINNSSLIILAFAS